MFGGVTENELRRNRCGAPTISDLELRELDLRIPMLDQRSHGPSTGCIGQIAVPVVRVTKNGAVEVAGANGARIITDPSDRKVPLGD